MPMDVRGGANLLEKIPRAGALRFGILEGVLTVLNALCARQDAVDLAIQTEAGRSSAEVGTKN
jgi:hypothetical protein